MERDQTLRTEHAVVFYENHDELIDKIANFLDVDDCVAVVVATPDVRRSIRLWVRDVVEIDAATLLDSFCRDGRLDAVAFRATVGDLIRSAAGDERPVRIYGEMVALLWERGLANQAIELETMWESLAEDLPFALLCGYPSSMVLDHSDPSRVNEVIESHPRSAVRAFEGSTSSIRAARHFVAEHLGEHPGRDVAMLITSELATNAVQHAASSFVVELDLRGEGVCVAVRDRLSGQVGAQQALMHEESGRGLSLVDALSTAWGVRATPHGKIVWAEIRETAD